MSATMQQVRDTFDEWFRNLEKICAIESPWCFLCLSALIDYLTRLANGRATGRVEYIQFIIDYLPARYSTFQYANGVSDLSEQMYYVLRSGIVHSFSLVPDPASIARGSTGRARSIVLWHARAAKEEGYSHLCVYRGDSGQFDAALFVAEDFLTDIRVAAYEMLHKAVPGSPLESNILSWFTTCPPIRSGP